MAVYVNIYYIACISVGLVRLGEGLGFTPNIQHSTFNAQIGNSSSLDWSNHFSKFKIKSNRPYISFVSESCRSKCTLVAQYETARSLSVR